VSSAIANLLRGGLIAGRRAADDRGDPGVAELEAIVVGDARGLTGKSQLVQDRIHEIARAIAGKGPPCTVCSMSSGCQAKDENTGPRISKAWDRASPVGLVDIGSTPRLADAAAIVAKAGAAFAIDDGFVDLLQ
jgi:hypothetical protein